MRWDGEIYQGRAGNSLDLQVEVQAYDNILKSLVIN